MYSPLLVKPMREELVSAGFEELLNAADVDRFMGEKEGTSFLVINSVCGCAAGQARPALRIALQHENKPDHVATVFAGQDLDATNQARAQFPDVPPSSPSAALLDADGKIVWFLPRHKIESRDAQTIAFDIVTAFDQNCA